MSADTEIAIHIGARIKYRGAVGTIRFIGALHDQGDEPWVGVQWDDAKRGKHSGTYAGHHYFACSVPNAATIVKHDKIARDNGGRLTFLQAARRRFDDAADHSHRDRSFAVGGGVVHIADEGDVAQKLAALSVLDVSGLGVAVVPSGDDDLTTALTALRDVCVARSLFTSVRAVLQLMRGLPSLHVLDASRNVLRDDDVPSDDDMSSDAEHDDDNEKGETEHRSAVRELVLNHCRVAWRGVALLSRRAPQLQQLRLHNCGLGDMGPLRAPLQCSWLGLLVLDLDGNHVTWDDVSALSRLPHLRELYVSHNDLPDHAGFNATASKDAHVTFPCLHTLSVADNAMAAWRFVTWLHSLPMLRHLRIGGNPISLQTRASFMPDGTYSWRLRVIGRIGGLQRVDGSWISMDERLQADRRYVFEEILPALRSTSSISTSTMSEAVAEAVFAEHPRGAALLAQHSDSLGGVGGSHKARGDARILRANVMQLRLVRGRGLAGGRTQAVRLLPCGIAAERVRAMARICLRVGSGVPFDMYASEDGDDDTTVALEDGRDLGVVGRLEAGCLIKVTCFPRHM